VSSTLHFLQVSSNTEIAAAVATSIAATVIGGGVGDVSLTSTEVILMSFESSSSLFRFEGLAARFDVSRFAGFFFGFSTDFFVSIFFFFSHGNGDELKTEREDREVGSVENFIGKNGIYSSTKDSRYSAQIGLCHDFQSAL